MGPFGFEFFLSLKEGVVNFQLAGLLLTFPLAWVAWALYGLAGQYLSLEGGDFNPTPHTQRSIVKLGLRAPRFTTNAPLTLKSLELSGDLINYIKMDDIVRGAATA
jgi:hypothetical protein